MSTPKLLFKRKTSFKGTFEMIIKEKEMLKKKAYIHTGSLDSSIIIHFLT
jgi:hypothetical protein